ncbi:MAG TPA: M81 family metallopeptidase, partial [Casimicrobiaceae bacterium]|nr:M81 family metallopeptidase [Casimicrobiaceae bacterium]
MPRRFVIALIKHETNTFSPLPTPITSFARRGAISGPAAIAEAAGTNTPLGGFVDLMGEVG